MNVGQLMADCDFILMASSHVYNGNLNDCQVLSDTFGHNVVSCRNFAVESGWLTNRINIVEANFDNDSQIVAVSSGDTTVFYYGKRHRGLPPDRYNFLDDGLGWQEDIHHLAVLIEQRVI